MRWSVVMGFGLVGALVFAGSGVALLAVVDSLSASATDTVGATAGFGQDMTRVANGDADLALDNARQVVSGASPDTLLNTAAIAGGNAPAVGPAASTASAALGIVTNATAALGAEGAAASDVVVGRAQYATANVGQTVAAASTGAGSDGAAAAALALGFVATLQAAGGNAVAFESGYATSLARHFADDVGQDTGVSASCAQPVPTLLPATQRDLVLVCGEFLAGLPL